MRRSEAPCSDRGQWLRAAPDGDELAGSELNVAVAQLDRYPTLRGQEQVIRAGSPPARDLAAASRRRARGVSGAARVEPR